MDAAASLTLKSSCAVLWSGQLQYRGVDIGLERCFIAGQRRVARAGAVARPCAGPRFFAFGMIE